MDNLLRKIPLDEEIVLFREEAYSPENIKLYMEQFDIYKAEGKIIGEFKDDIWVCNTGIKSFRINFHFNEVKYASHLKKDLKLTPREIRDMLKFYVLYICGEYIFRTIAQKNNLIKSVLTEYGDERYSIMKTDKTTFGHFLAFIGLPESVAKAILAGIHANKPNPSKQRELAMFVNYLAIDSELTDMYSSQIPDSEFVRWFPILFWVKITFVIPLRATEMLLTPFKCIEHRGKDTFILLRRSMLKKGHRTVYYDVDKDYHIFEYRIPNNKTVSLIEKYINLTEKNERRFLFDYSKFSTNGLMSLMTFNNLLEAFVTERLIGNKKYDFAKFATGIEEFSVVVAGDSRPIAMSNIFFQNNGAEICRQLADHENLKTSEGYFTNVAKTVEAASIMRMQKKIVRGYTRTNKDRKNTDLPGYISDNRSCSSPRRPKETGDITDCIKQGHIDDDCLGCDYYEPTESEVKKEAEKRAEKLTAAAKEMLRCVFKGPDIPDFDKVFLDAHTTIARYSTACDVNTKKAYEKWQRHKSTVMN